jgi:capsular polysaccharide biosynthesis protein
MVYLSRSKLDPSQRGLSEGQERLIEDIFRRYGFEIVHPQLLSLAEQIRTVRRASHVAGCVGSQMHLLAFSRNMGKHVLRLAPSYFDPGFDRDILEMGGGSYTGFVVERASPERSERSTLPWRLTPDELSGLRQKVEDWLSATATRG